MVARARKSFGKIFNAVNSMRWRAARREKRIYSRAVRMGFESLENRTMLSLLGVAPDVPLIAYDSTGVIHYNAAQQTFDLTATPLLFTDGVNFATVDQPASLAMHLKVDNGGNLIGGVPGDDFTVSGNIDVDGDSNYDYTGVLLTGEVLGFGYQEAGATDLYDMRFAVTGGALAAPYFAGKDIGITVGSEHSTFNNSFASDFTGGAKGNIGAIDQQLGSISGTKFHDTTGDGFSGDDTAFGGVTINLFKDVDNDGLLTAADGAAIASTTTDAVTGAYSFGNLTAGNYFVQEVTPAGYQQTAPAAPGYYAVSLGAGANVVGENFDNVKLLNINGTKFQDTTGNGLSGDDTKLGGTTINLFRDVDNDNMLTAADGAAIATTVSAAGTGAYSFGNLLPGRYFVQETVPAGYQQTAPASPNYYTVNLGGADSSGNDFDNLKYGSITGAKFQDATGNGITGDDTKLGGTTINLFQDMDHDGVLTAADGGPIASAVTASGTGAYSFGNLLPGTYFVQEVVPTGYARTVPDGNGTYTIVITSGVDSGSNNFANVLLSSISGAKYLDITGNGFSADDTALGGTTINLYKDVDNSGTLTAADGAAIATTTSAAGTGAFTFANLLPGNYLVAEVAGSGYSQTAPTANSGVYAVAISTGGTVSTGKNFDNSQVGSISGIKYKDITGNGFTGDDTVLGGTTISLFRDVDGSGTLTAADGAAIATTVTASNGTYSFSNLAPGKYLIQETSPSGYFRTAPTANGGVYAVTLNSGANASGNNYDNAQYGSISGTKYKDITGNGLSADDTGFAGVTINLYKDANGDNQLTAADGAPVATTVTGTGGTYSFTNLVPGTYFVQEVVPSGYSRTAPTANNGVYTIALNSGAMCSGNNFDNVQLSSISGVKYKDLTGDGKSADDTGLSGTTIKLYKDVDGDGNLTAADGSPVATTTSGTGGAWSFSGLLPGKYLVQEVAPTGYVRTGPTTQDYYAVNISTGGATCSGNNFYNFLIPVCHITNIIYCIDGVNYTTLAGHTHEGSVVKVTFTVLSGYNDTVSLVAYKAPSGAFDPNTASQQVVYQQVSGTYGPGVHTIQVTLPKCYYQVDFVCGSVIAQFGPNGSNIFYTQEGRLESADNSGDNDCIDKMCAAPSYWVSTATGKGQLLIKAFNGGSTAKTLATWLASNFPKLFGASSISARNMTGKTNTDVAAMMVTLNNGGTSTSAEARILATALSVYATTTALGGSTAGSYGFTVTAAGLGAANFSTETNGAAFGVANGTYKTVMQMLVSANSYATSGTVWSSNSTDRSQCLAEFTNITSTGGLV